jgi:phosphoribosylaminoimidazole-succinocarboxamide synthase
MAVAPRGRFVRSGKVKDIYELDDKRLLFYFTDRVSAFDVILPTAIPKKGEVLCKLSAFWFDYLGVPNHMVAIEGTNTMIVNRMTMIPVECVVRGYLYGSLFERLEKGDVSLQVPKALAQRLPSPYFDPTTKSEVKDEPITEQAIVDEGRMSASELQLVKGTTISIYRKMSERAEKAGFILADLKLEFGRDSGGNVILGDSIGPDEFRMWPLDKYAPGKTQESYDKQLVRDWLIQAGYKSSLDEARKSGAKPPAPPELPADLVSQVSERYVYLYERMTGRSL